MNTAWSVPLERFAAIDPAPLFVLSLLPYLGFLWWASKVEAFPRLALRGFQLTLLFVAVTIAAAIVAQVRFGALLADVDPQLMWPADVWGPHPYPCPGICCSQVGANSLTAGPGPCGHSNGRGAGIAWGVVSQMAWAISLTAW